MNLHEKINLSSGRELNLINRFAELLLDRERYAQVCREASTRFQHSWRRLLISTSLTSQDSMQERLTSSARLALRQV